jgi:hypothetical protein
MGSEVTMQVSVAPRVVQSTQIHTQRRVDTLLHGSLVDADVMLCTQRNKLDVEVRRSTSLD